MLEKYPDGSQLADARLQRAECLQTLGRVADGVNEFRRSLQAQRVNPNVRNNAWLDFACLIAFYGMSDLYVEASAVLDEFSSYHLRIFPSQRFQYAAARAFLADAKGERVAARELAKSAIENATAEHSGFRYPPQVGLVKDLDKQ